MRLGKDALVFTKHEKNWCIGFLSQTFLAGISKLHLPGSSRRASYLLIIYSFFC